MIAFGNHGSQLVCVSVEEENNLSQQGLKIVGQTGPVFATPFSGKGNCSLCIGFCARNGSFGTRTKWCVLNKELCTCD